MKRLVVFGLFLGMIVALQSPWADAGKKPGKDAVKEALAELNDYIGQWKGSGSIPDDKFLIWPENAEWSWRFKGKDSWLEMKIPDGKNIRGGELKYLPDDEEFEFTAVDKDNKKQVFKGTAKGSKLILERKDPATKELQQIEMKIAGDGIRFVLDYKIKPDGKTLFYPKYQVAFTKKGESFGTAAKKVECIVTGGLGTMAVSYNGQTYYVCCSGCRDAFNENPAKVIADYEKKKKK